MNSPETHSKESPMHQLTRDVRGYKAGEPVKVQPCGEGVVIVRPYRGGIMVLEENFVEVTPAPKIVGNCDVVSVGGTGPSVCDSPADPIKVVKGSATLLPWQERVFIAVAIGAFIIGAAVALMVEL